MDSRRDESEMTHRPKRKASLTEMNSCLAQKIVYAHIFTVKHMRYNFKP